MPFLPLQQNMHVTGATAGVRKGHRIGATIQATARDQLMVTSLREEVVYIGGGEVTAATSKLTPSEPYLGWGGGGCPHRAYATRDVMVAANIECH